MPTSTFSSAVMFWNSRMFWNVRPMPRCVILCGGLPGRCRRPSKNDEPRRRLVDAGEHVEERRLAGAVRADQADDRALGNGEVDVVDRDEAAELLAQPLRLEQRLAVMRRRSCRRSARRARRRRGTPRARRRGAPPSAARSGSGPPAGTASSTTRITPKIPNSYSGTSSGLCQTWTSAPPGPNLSFSQAPTFARPSRLRYARKHAPTITPQMLPMPPRMTMQRTKIEMLEVEVVRERAALVARVVRAGDAAEERADRVRPRLRAHQRHAHRRGGDLVLADRDPRAAEARVAHARATEDRDQHEHERRSRRRSRRSSSRSGSWQEGRRCACSPVAEARGRRSA